MCWVGLTQASGMQRYGSADIRTHFINIRIGPLMKRAAGNHAKHNQAPHDMTIDIRAMQIVLAASCLLMALMLWRPSVAVSPRIRRLMIGIYVASATGILLMHKERADELTHRLAAIDPLTGAYNRRTFIEPK